MVFNSINFSALDHIGTAIKDPEKYDEKPTESEEVDPIEPVKKSTTVFLNFSKKATPRFTNMNIPVTQMPTAQVKPNKGAIHKPRRQIFRIFVPPATVPVFYG